MILDTIALSARKRVEQKKQVKPLEEMMKAAYECREREGINREDGGNEPVIWKKSAGRQTCRCCGKILLWMSTRFMRQRCWVHPLFC